MCELCKLFTELYNASACAREYFCSKYNAAKLMNWLTKFADLPILWDVLIPIVVLLLFAVFLAWESRLPPEKKILRKLWKQRSNVQK
jgi:hypothetical protein